MADRIGRLTLPVVPPRLTPAGQKTPAAGDPSLVVLGSFLASVIQADVGEAFAPLIAGFPDLTNGTEPGRDGKTAVRKVHHNDLRRALYTIADAPILAVYRGGRQGAGVERLSARQWRRTTNLIVQWMPVPMPLDIRSAEVSTFGNAVSAAIQGALQMGRHRAWVHDSDNPIPEGILRARATATSDTTLTDLDGTEAARTLDVARPVTASTKVAVGAYNTADSIVVTGLDGAGNTIDVEIDLTKVNGGETAQSVWRLARPTSVFIPEQLTTMGAIRIGYAASPMAREGSPLLEHTGFQEVLMLSPGEWVQLPAPGVALSESFLSAYEMVLVVREDICFDPARHADPMPAGIAEGGLSTAALEATLLQPDGDVWSVDYR